MDLNSVNFEFWFIIVWAILVLASILNMFIRLKLVEKRYFRPHSRGEYSSFRANLSGDTSTPSSSFWLRADKIPVAIGICGEYVDIFPQHVFRLFADKVDLMHRIRKDDVIDISASQNNKIQIKYSNVGIEKSVTLNGDGLIRFANLLNKWAVSK